METGITHSDILIIGAGPAGLTAAYELDRHGLKSTIIEAEAKVGGLARTESYAGYRFDLGGHRFFSKNPSITALWHEILGEAFMPCPRLSRIFYDQQYFDYPLKPLNALRGLGVGTSLKILLDYLHSRICPVHDEKSFEDWVVNRFGRQLYVIFFQTYTEKVWGIPCGDISRDWAAQRIKNLSLRKAVYHSLKAPGRGRGKRQIPSLIDTFHYPRLGPGMLWEQCRDHLLGTGHSVHIGQKVHRIVHHQGRVESLSTDHGPGGQQNFSAGQFISSMPLKNLIRALSPSPPAEVVQAAETLRYRDYLTVVLIVNRAHVFPDNWIYVHSPEVKMGRIQNYKNWSEAMVPDPTKTVLGLEYFLWASEPFWTWSNAELIAFGTEECVRLGLLGKGEVMGGTVVRVHKAYPVYDVHYRKRVNCIRDYLSTLTNFQTVGRSGMHRYNNMDHAMLTGIYAARNIAGESHDLWAVNEDADYHEAGVHQHKTVKNEGDPMAFESVLSRI